MDIMKVIAPLLVIMTGFDAVDASSLVNVTITGLGVVQGIRDNSVEVFRGIPFAEAPIGDLRFKPPMPARWSGFRNATQFASMCPQQDYFSGKFILNEDCLYLNIFRPNKRTGKLSVMVWIHGGSFKYGGASEYDGQTLASHQGVIVVTIQYRLGVLGFFNIPNTAIKGNFGLLDQITALRWVKKNIADFDGDPTKVTIFGISAGGASVSLLTLSPIIKDEKLFARAIAQSGVGSNSWAVRKVTDDKAAREFGKVLGCNDAGKLVACLKGKSTREILVTQEKMVNTTNSKLGAPILDGEFLTELPSDLVAKRSLPKTNVPLIVGFTKDEGTYYAGNPLNFTRKLYENSLKWALKFYFGESNKVLEAAAIHEYTRYTSNQASKWYDSTSDLFGDEFFFVDILKLADAWSEAGNTVYTYLFSHLPDNLVKPYLKVAHGFERPYVFGYATVGKGWRYQKNYTATDRYVSVQCMEMWASFAKYGTPGKRWPKYASNSRQYLNIKYPLEVQSQPWLRRMAFWNKVIPRILKKTDLARCEDGIKSTSTSERGHFVLLLSSLVLSMLLV